jgi:hypothetical protein
MTAPRDCVPVPDAHMSAPGWPDLVITGAVRALVQVGLEQARSHLAVAVDALDGWYARRADPHTYVQDGHEAIHLIDSATRDLYQVRSMLVGEIRADEDERAVRVDRLLADLRAGRDGAVAGRPDGDPARDGAHGDPSLFCVPGRAAGGGPVYLGVARGGVRSRGGGHHHPPGRTAGR